jgi:hypothetical protein
LLADLFLRSKVIRSHYTDVGVLPRSEQALLVPAHELSVHTLSGAFWFQAALFAVAGLVALSLVVGYRTRTATVVSWFLLLSVHNRNPLIESGGVLLRLLLFWGVFLPLGARWSVDALGRADSRERVTSVASAAVLSQMVLLYGSNLIWKLASPLWLDGYGMNRAFSRRMSTRWLGDVLAQHPDLLHLLSPTWPLLLFCSPFLLLSTDRRRTAIVAAFVAFHLAMSLSLVLGVFTLALVVGLLPFLPASVWDALERRSPSALESPGDWLHATLPHGPSVAPSADVRSAIRQTKPYAVGGLLFVVVCWNVATIGGVYDVPGLESGPPEDATLVEAAGLDQSWGVYARFHEHGDAWYVVPGNLTNGSRVDVFHRRPVRWERPPDVSNTYPNTFWQKYLLVVYRFEPDRQERNFARYLCNRWNGNRETPVRNVSVYVVHQETRVGEPEPTTRRHLHAERCPRFANATWPPG